MPTTLVEKPKEEAPGRPDTTEFYAKTRKLGLAGYYDAYLTDEGVVLLWPIVDPSRMPWRPVIIEPVWPFRQDRGEPPVHLKVRANDRTARATIPVSAEVRQRLLLLRKETSLPAIIDLEVPEEEPPPPGSFLAPAAPPPPVFGAPPIRLHQRKDT